MDSQLAKLSRQWSCHAGSHAQFLIDYAFMDTMVDPEEGGGGGGGREVEESEPPTTTTTTTSSVYSILPSGRDSQLPNS